MTKIITRCFQGGGAVSNACRRLAKSALTAFALIAATFTANAANVIAVNFEKPDKNGGGTFVDDTVYSVIDNVLPAGIVGKAWNIVKETDGVKGTVTLTKELFGDMVVNTGTVSLRYASRNFWYNNDDGNQTAAYPFFKNFLDDGDHDNTKGPTLDFSNIPYETYDVIIYASGDGSSVHFRPVRVNGTYYTYKDGHLTTVTVPDGQTYPSSDDNWGVHQIELEVGTDVMILSNLSGSTLSIQGGNNDGSNGRGGIGAVAIVDRSSSADYVPPAFTYGPNPAAAPTGWFTAWNTALGNNRMIGPEGVDALMLNGNTPQSGEIELPQSGNVTIAAIVNLDNVKSEGDNLAVIFSLGKVARGDSKLHAAQALVLSKKGDDLYLNNVKKTNGGTVWASPNLCLRDNGDSQDDDNTGSHGGRAYCIFQNIGAGYHLVVATQSQTDNRLTLSVDGQTVTGANPDNSNAAVEYLGDTDRKGGLRLGACYGRVDGTVPYGRFRNSTGLVVDRVMAWDSALTEGQLATLWNQYAAVIEHQGELSYNSSFATANAAIYVPSVSSTEHTLSVTGGGTMNIPATAVVDVPSVSATGNAASTITVDGGSVTSVVVRTDNNKNRVNIQNGGSLYFAHYEGSASIVPTVNCGKGTLGAVASGDYTTGWELLATVNFNDATDGTTIDANGLTASFTGNTAGSGKVIIADSSENGGGKVKFAAMNGMTGAIVVRSSATLDLGAARPAGTIEFEAGAKLVLAESLADENGIVALTFTGTLTAENVELTGADGQPIAVAVANGQITYKPSANLSVSGEACWYDFEFKNSSYKSTGRNKASLVVESNNGIGRRADRTDFKDDETLYTAALSWMDVTYPESWSAAIYATIPATENAVLMAFGTNGGGLIGLACGNPADNEVKLVRTTGTVKQYVPLSTMTVKKADSTPHLYVFSKDGNTIKVYLDGNLKTTYTPQDSSENITFGPGFQIASVHGTTTGTGLVQFTAPNAGDLPDVYENSYIDVLRMYDSPLSEEAIAALAEEFPYDADEYRREVSGDVVTITWSSDNAWTKDEEPFAEPAQDSRARLTVGGAVTVNVDDEQVSLEKLTIDGSGSVTFVSLNGATLNAGDLEINGDVAVTLPHTVTAPGTLKLDDDASLTFDYSGYELELDSPNASLALTGLAPNSQNIHFTPPTNANAKGRTFEFAYNQANSTWYVSYSRPAYTLYWVGTAATGDWNALDVWQTQDSTAAAFLEGDSVVFGNVDGVDAVTVTIPQAVKPASITINATTTQYTLNDTINVDGAAITIASDAAITGLAGTAGTVNITGSNVTLGSGSALAIATAATVSADTALTIGGTGTITYTGGGTAFQGTLEVASGTFVVESQFNAITATEQNPVKVTGSGRLYLKSEGYNHNRMPGNAYIEVDGANAVLELQGNNPLPRDEGLATISCKNGTIRVDTTTNNAGESGKNNVWANDIILDSGRLYFKLVNGYSYSYQSLQVNGTLTVKGNSTIDCDANMPDYLVLKNAFVVDEGATLTCDMKVTDGNGGNAIGFVKDGAGTLVIGSRFTTQGDTITVTGGALKADDGLANWKKNLVFAGGTVFDLSALTDAYDLSGFTSVTLNGKVTLDLGARAEKIGTKLLTWANVPTGKGRFNAKTASGKIYSVEFKDDGAYLASGGFVLRLR